VTINKSQMNFRLVPNSVAFRTDYVTKCSAIAETALQGAL